VDAVVERNGKAESRVLFGSVPELPINMLPGFMAVVGHKRQNMVMHLPAGPPREKCKEHVLFQMGPHLHGPHGPPLTAGEDHVVSSST
jgi:hypothetical protein